MHPLYFHGFTKNLLLHKPVIGFMVNVWANFNWIIAVAVTAAEAIGTSPQLRDDIHRVLSRANDAFEDSGSGIGITWQVPSFCRIE